MEAGIVENAPHALDSPRVEFTVVVPTLGRWRAARLVNTHERALRHKHEPFILVKTLAFLSRHNISPERVCLFVSDEDEQERYRRALRRSAWRYVRIVVGVRGIRAQRNFIVDYFPDGERIVSIDDDITDVMWKHKPGQKGDLLVPLPAGAFEGLVFDAFNRMATYGSFICGLHSTISCQVRNMHVDGVSTRNGEVNGFLYFFLNRHRQALLPAVADATEDAERSLRYFTMDGSVLRYRMYCGVTSCGDNLYGLQGTFTEGCERRLPAIGKERRKLAETAAAKRLHELFPTLAARPVPKRLERTLGVKFLHKGGAVIPSTTIEAFRKHHAAEEAALAARGRQSSGTAAGPSGISVSEAATPARAATPAKRMFFARIPPGLWSLDPSSGEDAVAPVKRTRREARSPSGHWSLDPSSGEDVGCAEESPLGVWRSRRPREVQPAGEQRPASVEPGGKASRRSQAAPLSGDRTEAAAEVDASDLDDEAQDEDRQLLNALQRQRLLESGHGEADPVVRAVLLSINGDVGDPMRAAAAASSAAFEREQELLRQDERSLRLALELSCSEMPQRPWERRKLEESITVGSQ